VGRRSLKWQERARCRGSGPDLWFSDNPKKISHAKRVCGGCEVWDICLSYAILEGEKEGVWGGMDERERRRMTRLGSLVAGYQQIQEDIFHGRPTAVAVPSYDAAPQPSLLFAGLSGLRLVELPSQPSLAFPGLSEVVQVAEPQAPSTHSTGREEEHLLDAVRIETSSGIVQTPETPAPAGVDIASALGLRFRGLAALWPQ
jgi:WhiB family redox-sensing transcriptional regulator